MANLVTDPKYKNPLAGLDLSALSGDQLYGVREKLKNLGYYQGPIDQSPLSFADAGALGQFQYTFGYGDPNSNLSNDVLYGLDYANGQVVNGRQNGYANLDPNVLASLKAAGTYNPALGTGGVVNDIASRTLPTSYPDDKLDPLSIQLYANQQSQAKTGYENQLAQQDYLKSKYGSDYQHNLSDYNFAQDQARNKLPGSYAGRGLLNSGIYQQGLSDYYDARYKGADNLKYGYDQQLSGLNQQGIANEKTYNNTVANIGDTKYAQLQALKAQNRVATASQLRAIQ